MKTFRVPSLNLKGLAEGMPPKCESQARCLIPKKTVFQLALHAQLLMYRAAAPRATLTKSPLLNGSEVGATPWPSATSGKPAAEAHQRIIRWRLSKTSLDRQSAVGENADYGCTAI